MPSEAEYITVYLQDIKWNEPSITLQVEPQYTALDIVKTLVNKTRQFNHNSYELAEIFVSSGQLCKERRLDMSEIPYKVQGLWPKGGALAPDATYRFYLVRKGGPGGFLRSLSWTDCNHSLDASLDSYFMKFLEQKTAGENYADLCSLPDLNETTLLENLRQRFYTDAIYTYVGTILIAINPFKFFPIYNPKYVAMYQETGARFGELPPHIFAIANAAFTSMLDTQSDQCIVISGESGSGKTENTNFLLHHLTQNKQSQQSHCGSGVEQTLLGAGPVLEAFGNAKTVHNDNSSRFGKFILVDFRKNGAVHGASVEKYLLEKSRIVSQSTNERNYHVFYYLLNGASPELSSELFLLQSQEYQYLNQSGCYTSPGVDEIHEFERLKRSMEMVGFKSDLQKRIFAVISAILLLGNVEFVKKHTYHHDDAVQVKNLDLVAKICKLLDVKEESFLEALTSKRTVAGGETVVVRYKLEDAISARNAMAKCLYGAIFDWMVWQINHALYQKQDHKNSKSNSIGVLDIFGFEDFLQNSFEQFCINYANEHLQFYFNQHIFKFEQEEYSREKIDWQNISFIDNRKCLDLFAKKPSGLFFLLDEEGNFPGATNETLLAKFHQNHKSSDFYEMPLRRESTFTIKHYAGKVKYNIQYFREKNSDLIHADLVSVLKNSSTGFVRELVGNKIGNIRRKTSVTQKQMTREHLNLPWSDNSENEGGDKMLDDTDSFIHNTAKKTKRKHSAKRRQKMYKDYKQFKTHQEVKNRETSKAKTPSVSLQFQKSLQSLLETLDRSHPYFVRCIKSNMEKTPCKFDDKLVHRQLQYTGMLATVKLRQSGYNYRVLIEDFVHTYAALLPTGTRSTKEDVGTFLTSMDNNHIQTSFQVGKTKVFLRETLKMLLDDALHHTLLRQILRIQSWVRRVLARTRYTNMKHSAVVIQKTFRGFLTRQVVSPQLELHRRKLRQRLEEEKLEEERQRVIEAEQLEQRMKLEVEEEERKRRVEDKKMEELAAREKVVKIQKAREDLQNKSATLIQCWYKKHKCIMDAKVQQRAATLSNRPTELMPTTDIDQLAQSIEDGAVQSPTSPTKVMIESWIDTKSPSINGHSPVAESPSVDKDSQLSESTSEKYKQEAKDEVSSIDVSGAVTNKGEAVKRRTSITRKSAFRRRSTKDDDKLIPVVQKKSPPSPSITSTESYSSPNSSVQDSDLIYTPQSPTKPFPQKVDTDSVRSMDETSKENKSILRHSRSFSDKTETVKRNVPNASNESLTFKPKPVEHNAESFFYIPDSRPPFPRLHSKGSTELSSPTSSLPEIVIDRPHKLPMSLPLVNTTAPEIRSKEVFAKSPVIAKLPVRRTSSNDPEILRRASSRTDKSSPGASGLLSPEDAVSPTDRTISRQGSHASSVEFDDTAIKFTRTHILRKNVQVRKSQSADNLAPFTVSGPSKEHDIDLKQPSVINGRHMSTVKSQSFDHLSKKEHFEDGKVLGVSNLPGNKVRSKEMVDSDDSDLLSGSFYKVPAPVPHDTPVEKKRAELTGPANTSKKVAKSNHQFNQWTVSSTSEWNYPDDLAIMDCEEIPELARFIHDKYVDFRGKSNQDDGVTSVYDRVFRDAMMEMNKKLNTQGAISHNNPYNFRPLKFRDLMSSFSDYVAGNVAKVVSEENIKDFPSTIAINAFRGYLDEYQKKRKPMKRKAAKVKAKEHKKKPHKELLKILGHRFVSTQFTMPTYCEVCNKMMFWNIRVPGLECENCKFSCHKKCSTQININCQKTPAEELRPNAVFKVPLQRLAGEDNAVPDVLEMLIAELDNRGVYADGIYRKAGIASKVRALQKALDTDWESVNLADYAVHVLSQTLKNFFRELPEPLFTFELYDEFIRCPGIADQEEAIGAMRATVDKLPHVNFNIISRLMVHLARVAQNEATNRMSPNSLAIVFAPGLLRTNKPMTAQESLAQVDKQCRSIELMLNATLRKLNTTLSDINQLESEEQNLEDRLTDVRQSMRKHGSSSRAHSKKVSMRTHMEGDVEQEEGSLSEIASVSETMSTTSEAPLDLEMAEQEAIALSAKIKTVQERKFRLRQTIPRLTLTSSDGDDMLSADDIESSAESFDGIE